MEKKSYYDVKEQLFSEALFALRNFMVKSDLNDEWSSEYDRAFSTFKALYSVIDSVPNLETEFIAFKSDVLRELGITGHDIKHIDTEDLAEAIDRVIKAKV